MSSSKCVFTNGCFDVIHVGHINLLRWAKGFAGDGPLIVGVNSDESIKRLKGDSRPINPLSDRVAILSELKCVDLVIPFWDDTPLRLIEELKPHVLVKGGDWDGKVVGQEFVESYGGQVYTFPLTSGKSSTTIINKFS